MHQAKTGATQSRTRRKWLFANCSFDEATRTLTVSGKRVTVETKPLEILHTLLIRAGDVVAKGELLDAVWPNVTVVEASLPTAVRKLRIALGDEKRGCAIIETVPGIGYRLAVPVELTRNGSSQPVLSGDKFARRNGLTTAALALAGIVTFVVLLYAAQAPHPTMNAPAVPSEREQLTALRRLDLATVDRMISAGWNPNKVYDDEGNSALDMLMTDCEWDPGHDREKMVLVARAIIDAGGRLDQRNTWGDTPYSIAKAKRYCGPDHPVTKMMRALCFNGYRPLGTRCLASYEVKRRAS